jgi:hypothetical protein
VRARSDLRSPDHAVAFAGCVAFTVAFSTVNNVHHGATPSMSRYALWVIPLAIPLLRCAHERGGAWWRRFVRIAAAASAFVCVVAFHPGTAENAREPTYLASYLWNQHPTWNNPLPEVFAEVLLNREARLAPVATAGCQKILLVGRQADAGVWPMPCCPAPIPASYRLPGVLSYANRVGRDYAFVRAPLPQHVYTLRDEVVWPAGSEARVREVFQEWQWWELALDRKEPRRVAKARGVESVWEWAGPDRSLVVLAYPGQASAVAVSSRRHMNGRIIDIRTGASTPVSIHPGTSEIPLASGRDTVMLLLLADAGSPWASQRVP